MSRVGNRPIKISPDITVDILVDRVNLASGGKMISIPYPNVLSITFENQQITISRKNDSKYAKSQHGLIARLIANANSGLSSGIEKTLDFKGTGYRAKVENGKLEMNMGYSHANVLSIPENLQVSVIKNSIKVSGYDKYVVGNFAAKIRDVRKPEVYKGKGIKYKHETIKLKAGKVASGGKG